MRWRASIVLSTHGTVITYFEGLSALQPVASLLVPCATFGAALASRGADLSVPMDAFLPLFDKPYIPSWTSIGVLHR